MKTNKILVIAILFLSHCFFAQIPLLNSNPTSTRVVYLDFDGQSVSGTAFNTSYSITTINAAPSTMSSANIIQIWKRISEDYRPFDVNITTDSTKFNSAIINFRIRIIITPTSSWYGTSAGGLAYFGSFNWGGNPGTPGWVFENLLLNNPKHIAESCSHEVGHSLSLKHQSTWTASPCSKTAEYNPGQGSGITSWAPIMGVGYYKNVTIWHKGTNSTSCTFIQSDHGSIYPGISAGYLAFLPDDVGDTFSAAKTLNLNTVLVKDSGIITQPTDIDVYKFEICTNRYITFDVKPWALDTSNYDAANLDVRFQLFDAVNNSLAIDTPLTKLNTLVGLNLNAGSYYFTIDGGGSANYSDYGSLGKYYVNVSSNNIPNIISAITSSSVACVGQAINFTDASSGSPTAWTWMFPGASPASSSLQNPSTVYNTSGTYTVTLSASNGTLSSCSTTKSIIVGTCTNLEKDQDLSEAKWMIYPNPVIDHVTIETQEVNYSFEIISALGTLIYKQDNIKDHIINIKTDTWVKGIYFAKAISENKKQQVIMKLIIL